ncbi:NAD(P)/FAD-dependent oxidoreductase [Pannus brasiliensis CCIBt3594]|uniref:NAD(P)/FAD-dependent oxidoreductase n=1 Tax=Pannus brasiliensis CCIBt3594 TaxID=1427578 RepID=A0AAW9QSU7_9CHRO
MEKSDRRDKTPRDIVIIGSGIGGLVAGALLARNGRDVLICESHTIAGGAAHSFTRKGFHFDSGPSFYCGLGNQNPSRNPLKQVLDLLGESLEVVPYDPLGFYHFPDRTIPIYCQLDRYCQEIAKISPSGARELEEFQRRLLAVYDCLQEIKTINLRADWRVIPDLLFNSFGSLLKAFPQLPIINSSVGKVMSETVTDPRVKRLIDLECFLLSGLKAEGTIAPEVAFMLGERNRSNVEYPIGGSGAIIDALVRGLTRFGGELRLNCTVEKILVKSGRVTGVRLQNGEEIPANTVISNATIWDTYGHLLEPEDLPVDYRKKALETPAIDSFLHLHLGIKADGLEGLAGHHVVVHSDERDITEPGNTCMISIPTVWDKKLAPDGHHAIHAYTLEPYDGWRKDSSYEERKRRKAEILYRAIERVIPDLRERIVLESIGTPLTHARFLRRHRGTYGPGIVTGQGMFPSCHTPIKGLYRVGDSTLPGIGVPAVAMSGILCANTLKN